MIVDRSHPNMKNVILLALQPSIFFIIGWALYSLFDFEVFELFWKCLIRVIWSSSHHML